MAFTRRDFFKGAAVAGVGGVAAGLMGCAPNASKAELSTTGAEANAPEQPSADSTREAWLGEEPNITDADVTSTMEADVVVIGISDAGAIAVRAAVEEGASVIAVDKSEALVTSGSDVAVFNGRLQAALGRDTIDPKEVVDDHQVGSGHRTKASIMNRYVNEMAATFDWIIEADPDMFVTENSFPVLSEEEANHALIPARYPDPDPSWDYHNELIPTYPATFNVKNLNHLVSLNYELAKSEGDVQEYFGHFAEKLIMEEGRCVGAYIRNAGDGSYLRANAKKGVILCTGDYSSNDAMMQAFLPDLMEMGAKRLWLKTDVNGDNTNTGDGQRMGVWAGAKLQKWHCPGMHHMGGGAGPDGRGVMGNNGYLNLNLLGKRFMNEDVPGQQVENQIELQPKMTTYQFFDAKWPEQLSSFPAAHGTVCYFSEEPETSYINHRSLADVENAVAEGRCLQADTIEELLAQIEGMDTATAKTSIERYNELCHKGVDEDFGKIGRRLFALENPPYYAVKFEPCLVLTVYGGLSSDEDCHTYTEDDDVIPGLYVAGNVMGDRFALQKPISVCGLAVGMALFYGAVAGRNAAREV